MRDPRNEAPTAADHSPAARWHGRFSFFVAPMFLGLAAWMWFGPEHAGIPAAATPPVDRLAIVPGPLRQVLLTTDPPQLHLNGFDRTCMDCHRTFSNPDPRLVHLAQHAHIELKHGINTHCYHCHDQADRNLLVARNGETIPYPRVVDLCGQCHSGIRGDWLAGVHGKRLGFWDEAKGARAPIVCTGCHDPHWPSRPAMSGLAPLAAPNTLRMGEPVDGGDEGESADPLQRALRDHRSEH